MKRLAALKREGERAAAFRGHRLGAWCEGEGSAVAVCVDCGRQVAVAVSPPANGIDVGGEAVAVNCGEARALCSHCSRVIAEGEYCARCAEQGWGREEGR